MRRMKDKIEATVTNADYATSAGSASKATNATNATKATTADKLGTSAGSTTQPVYFKDGKPAVIGYTVAKSVPADAKFTDTNTWRGIQNNLTSDSTDQSLSAAQGKALKTLVDGKADKGHTHDYLPLGGGTMSGSIIKSTGGSWIGDRDRVAIKSSYPGDNSYGAVAGIGTKNGYWTMGNLGKDERLIFNYSTDTNYNAGKNNTSQVYLPAQAGTIITSATIGSQSVNYANSAGSVKDAGNNSSNTTFAYSKAGMNYGDYTWLAGWNGYELRAVNKNQYLPTAGGTMNGDITFSDYSHGKIYAGPTDNVNGPGGDLNNIVLESWWGLSFTTGCPNQTYTGKTAVGVDCREGIVKAARFDGTLNGTAATLGRGGNSYAPMTFNWSGKDGQPTWLWGGEDGTNMYVYNPANFVVHYADWANGANNGVVSYGFGSNSDGYIRFINGVQICWGRTNCSGKDTTINFSAAFSNSSYSVSTMPFYSNLAGTYWNVKEGSMGTTSFVLHGSKSSIDLRTMLWIAIGKWN